MFRQSLFCILVVFRLNPSMIIILFFIGFYYYYESIHSLPFLCFHYHNYDIYPRVTSFRPQYVLEILFVVFRLSMIIRLLFFVFIYLFMKSNYPILSLCFNYHNYNCPPCVTIFWTQYDHEKIFIVWLPFVIITIMRLLVVVFIFMR